MSETALLDDVVVLDPIPLRVLVASAELAPVCRVGGLSDAVSGLVTAMRRHGLGVTAVMPDYGDRRHLRVLEERRLAVPAWAEPAVARTVAVPGFGEVVMVDVPGMAKAHPYNDPATGRGWADNDARFMAFSVAVAALTRELRPDVVHLNDWHTAAATAWLPSSVASVLTVHNLAYQGAASRSWVQRLGVTGAAFDQDGRFNPLAGGVTLADRVVAVSPSYALETRKPAGGAGLDWRLRARGSAYSGIRNGIDVDRWNPAVDAHLPATFDWPDLAGKEQCRRELLRLAGFEDDDQPLVGMVCRLVEQKGVDVAMAIAPQLRGIPARMVVMGRGVHAIEDHVARVAAQRPHRVAYLPEIADSLAHLLVAGSDLLLVPSRFEPCGLTPMEAMRCGTIPVVSPVGGLRDSVVDASADPVRGNGFVAPAADAVGVSLALGRAVRALSDPERRRAIQRNGMTADWSWRVPGDAYRRLYGEVIADRAAASAALITDATSSRISGRAFDGAPLS